MKENYSIVIADDDPDDHFLFLEAIKKINISSSLTSVYDGAELLNLLLKKDKYANNVLPNPDIIILDLNMPILDGFDTLEKVKANINLSGIPVYVMSNSNDAKQTERIMELGAKGFYTKPNKNGELQQIIAEILITL
jgi:CheY-like chemotaxis protein